MWVLVIPSPSWIFQSPSVWVVLSVHKTSLSLVAGDLRTSIHDRKRSLASDEMSSHSPAKIGFTSSVSFTITILKRMFSYMEQSFVNASNEEWGILQIVSSDQLTCMWFGNVGNFHFGHLAAGLSFETALLATGDCLVASPELFTNCCCSPFLCSTLAVISAHSDFTLVRSAPIGICKYSLSWLS